MKKLMVAAFAAVVACVSAQASNFVKFGEDGELMTFDEAIAAVSNAAVAAEATYHGKMLILTEDVTSSINLAGLGDWDFAGIDLNGFNLTNTSTGLIGTDGANWTYTKTFNIPATSTLWVKGQVKFRGPSDHIKINLAGTFRSSRDTYSFKLMNTDVEFIGPSPKMIGDGCGAWLYMNNTYLTFNMEGLTEPYAEPPIEIYGVDTSKANSKYANIDVSSSVRFKVANTEQMQMNMGEAQTITMLKADPLIPQPSGGMFRFEPNLNNLPSSIVATSDTEDKENLLRFTFNPVIPAAALCEDGVERVRCATFTNALALATHNDTVKLLSDVSRGSWTNIGDMDFAGLDLNGHDLTISGSFYCGGDSVGATYGKVFTIPAGSTLTASDQIKINGGSGKNCTLNLTGKFVGTRDYYTFVIKNVNMNLSGPSPQILASGNGKMTLESNEIAIDMDGVTAPYAEPLFYLPNITTNRYDSGFSCTANNRIAFLNYSDYRDALEDDVEIPLMQQTDKAKVSSVTFVPTLADALPEGCAIKGTTDKTRYWLAMAPRYTCAIGETKYETLAAAVEAAGSTDIVKLLCDYTATTEIDWTETDFGGLDLNGRDFTLNGSEANFYCGRYDQSKAASSAKTFTIPEGSTFTVGGQFKVNGSAAEPVKVIVGGTMRGTRNFYSFSFSHCGVEFVGANPQITTTGTGGMIRFVGCDLVFDFDGVSSWYANAPIYAPNITQKANDSGVAMYGNSTVAFRNDATLRAGIASPTDCLLAVGSAENSTRHSLEADAMPAGVVFKQGDGDYVDNFYLTIGPVASNVVDVDGLMVTITDDALANVFGGVMPDAAALKANAANGYKVFEDYILGIDPTISAIKPLVNFREASSADKLALGVDNVNVYDDAGVTVTFTLKSDTEADGSFDTEEADNATGEFEINMPEEKAKFFRIGFEFE